jgi:hypothetical protein
MSGTPVRDAVHGLPCLLICWREWNDQESGPGERDGRRAGRLRVPAGPGRMHGMRPPDCYVCHRMLSDLPGEGAQPGLLHPDLLRGNRAGEVRLRPATRLGRPPRQCRVILPRPRGDRPRAREPPLQRRPRRHQRAAQGERGRQAGVVLTRGPPRRWARGSARHEGFS